MRSIAIALMPVLIVLCCVASTGHARNPLTIHVPGDYPTIQQGLDAAEFSDIVLVAPGTYHENLLMDWSHDGVRLISAGGPEVTIIDGGGIQRVFLITEVGPQTRVEGFTIQNGRAEPFTSDNLGGGFYLSSADLRIENNIIQYNFAEAAGGLYLNHSAPTLYGNRLLYNEALASGGAIYLDNASDARIEYNVIAHNTCGHFGAGITIWVGSEPSILSNTIVYNDAQDGGGIFLNVNSHAEIFRNIITGSIAGGGIRIQDSQSTVTFACNDVWDNNPINYSGMPDLTGVDGNISGDPQFCDAPVLDFRLGSISPCAPGNSPGGCNLIGALDVGCGPVAIERTTWGTIKSTFRGDE